jgi:threonylcarbamoyladenosine tRNA methylthiotransferase MtaB
MREILLKSGFSESLSKDKADVYIINTCTVTHHADKECRYMTSLFHRTNPDAIIVVAGCYAEKNADEILALPGVTHIVKNYEKGRIAKILNGQNDRIAADDPHLSITEFKGRTKAFVKIQDGCENRCSYCKIPLVRGALKSKPQDRVTEEVLRLAAAGFKEIVLTGICLGAWGRDISPSGNLAGVLKAIMKTGGDFRVRLSSIEPKYVADELIEFMAGTEKVCRHLHIPLQSGDDEILKYMNRPYSTAEYRSMTDKLRRAMPDIAITTDVIVGFPGETDTNFQNSLKFVKDILPARTHTFTYSKRDGTPAFDMPGEVSEAVAKKRHLALTVAALEASHIYRSKFLNKILDVLVEKKRDKNSGLLTGYSDNYIKVLFEGDDALMGKMVSLRLEGLTLHYSKGRYAGT